MIVDAVQAYIEANIAGVNAPANGAFPSTNITGILPVATTWEGSSTNPFVGIRASQIIIRVFVATAGLNTWAVNKDECERLHDAFFEAFDLRGDDSFIQDTPPPIRITPDTLSVGPYYNVIEAPDGERFHGFQVNFEATAHVDVSSCPS
jgi:hypothetical protein